MDLLEQIGVYVYIWTPYEMLWLRPVSSLYYKETNNITNIFSPYFAY